MYIHEFHDVHVYTGIYMLYMHACMSCISCMHACMPVIACMSCMHACHARMSCMHVMHACHACMSCMHALGTPPAWGPHMGTPHAWGPHMGNPHGYTNPVTVDFPITRLDFLTWHPVRICTPTPVYTYLVTYPVTIHCPVSATVFRDHGYPECAAL